MSRKLMVFLCHASQDKPVVQELYQRLLVEGWIDPWLDKEKLLIGEDFDLEIEKAIEDADAVIVFISSNAVKKTGYIQKELRLIYNATMYRPEGELFAIPLRLEDCNPPQRFKLWLWGDYFGKEKQNTYASLLKSLKSIYSQVLHVEAEEREQKESKEKLQKDEDFSRTVVEKWTYKEEQKQSNSFTSNLINQLVVRREQVDRFADIIDCIIQQRFFSSNIFEWYGSPGIGKSNLVSLLIYCAVEKHALWVSVNFKKLDDETREIYVFDPTVLLEDMISNLKRQSVLNTHEFDSAIKEFRRIPLPELGVVYAYSAMNQETRLYNRPNWLIELKDVVVAFIKLMISSHAQVKTIGMQPIVLFFDETEHIDIQLVDWIEEWVINPLIQTKNCVVVWTARRPWRWKRPEIRRRLTSEILRVFDPNGVSEQIQHSAVKPRFARDLFNYVYSLTGGHPFASQIVINDLNILAKQGVDLTPETFLNYEPKLISKVFHEFIEGYVFSELHSSDLKTACKFIALVRSFDSTMLREVLVACAGEGFKTWNQDDFGHLLLSLKKTQLLVWENGLAIDPGLRYVIQNYFIVIEPDIFIQVNKAALRVYAGWLEHPVDNRSLLVLEELYHHAALLHVGEHVDLIEILDRRLAEYPNYIKDDSGVFNALERLETEITNDKELEQFTHSAYELARQVRAFRDKRYAAR